MVKLKVGRDILNIDNNDLILDNGACYQIITKAADDTILVTVWESRWLPD